MEQSPVGKFSWMPAAMPKIVQMVAAKRREWGDAHVTNCVNRGLRGEPGWFFAREGPIAVGTPDPTWSFPEFEKVEAALPPSNDRTLLVMRPPGAGDGAR